MNRRQTLVSSLLLALAFTAGYSTGFFTKSSRAPAAAAANLSSAPTPAAPLPAAQPAPLAPSASQAINTDALQLQLDEKNRKIAELQQKLNHPTTDAVSPEEDTPEYREKLAAELLELTRTKDMIQQAFKASAQGMAKDLSPEGQEALSQALTKIYSWDKMEKVFSKIYTDVFSAQELNDMAEFYRSDVGAAMLRKQPEVMQKSMQLVQQINQEALPKLTAEMEAISKKYRLKTASKPETPAKTY